jgi:hypothetical protein
MGKKKSVRIRKQLFSIELQAVADGNSAGESTSKDRGTQPGTERGGAR